MREHGLPLFVDDDHLAVLDRDGNVTRLPLTGDGAVTALAPYRHTSSETSEEHGRGIRTWWRVAGMGRRPPGSSQPEALAQVGFSAGRSWERSSSVEVEWGIAALDRDGNVLLRMRPLRARRRMRGFAADCGLEFVEQQITDPGRLAPAPEVITSTSALLGTGARNAIETVSWLLALTIGFAVYAALGGGVVAAIVAVVAGLGGEFLIQRLLTRCGVRIAMRSRT
ncbi:hypothetical protein [Pseudonocardia adelaidensis]|uniref:Uncharacterized protein n=1 Tax=Pseudonocardia adelaidensis TaxID=648754 RepID=A0ABP9NH30_9PSEU